MVMVTAGRGAGQQRVLVEAAYDPARAPITIDRPWDVEPDATSTLVITKWKGRFLVAGNTFSAEG
jgi:hypothetical protein